MQVYKLSLCSVLSDKKSNCRVVYLKNNETGQKDSTFSPKFGVTSNRVGVVKLFLFTLLQVVPFLKGEQLARKEKTKKKYASFSVFTKSR